MWIKINQTHNVWYIRYGAFFNYPVGEVEEHVGKIFDICQRWQPLNSISVQLSYFANKLVSKGKLRKNVWLPIALRCIIWREFRLFGLISWTTSRVQWLPSLTELGIFQERVLECKQSNWWAQKGGTRAKQCCGLRLVVIHCCKVFPCLSVF